MLTVLLATKNRARILRDVLESYCNLLPLESGWKLIVVDNGSTDETRQVVESFGQRLPVEYLFEATAGKNSALNAGLQKLEGDLAVFTDDDAFPNPDWLLELREAADSHPQFSTFGGVIVPRWESPPPPWLQWVELGPVFTITDPALDEGQIPANLVFGPNMAIRSSVFQAGSRFDPSFGPRASSYPMGSETEFVLRLEKKGHLAWFAKRAVVEHLVRQSQLSQRWVLGRAFRYGRGRYRMYPNPKVWVGIPRHLVRDIPKEAFKIAYTWIFRRRKDLFVSRWHFSYLCGVATEAWILSRSHGTLQTVE